jgi:hypothetical protein
MLKITWEPSSRNSGYLIGRVGRWDAIRIMPTSFGGRERFHFRCYLPVHEPVGFADSLDEAKAMATKIVADFTEGAGLEQKP